MTTHEKQEIINRLFSEYQYYKVDINVRKLSFASKIKNLVSQDTLEFFIKSPSSQILYEANNIYNDTIKYYRFSDFYNEETIVDMMKQHIVLCEESKKAEEELRDPIYYWSDDFDDEFKSIAETIDNTKIRLFENAKAPKSKIEQIRKTLETEQKKYNFLYTRKQQFDYMTAEYMASKFYARYLYSHTVYDKNKKQIKGLSYNALDNIAFIVDNNRIPSLHIRELSHTSPWLNYYHTMKPNPFNNKTLSGDILSLMQLSRWYESIYSHPEHPDDDIINDNDMIDGWWLKIEREKPKQKDNAQDNSITNSEVFIMARSNKEADDIYCKNDKMARSIIYNRTKQLAETKGTVKNHELFDVKFDLGLQANRQASQAIMNNKR